MADLIALLSNAGAGLAAHRAATQTASHNIENVNTPGYSRQRAELVSQGAEFLGPGSYLGLGVTLQTITQARDRFIEAQMPGAFANDGRSSAEANALSSVHALDPEMAGGLKNALGDFYAAARAMSQNPGDVALRHSFYAATRALSQSFNSTAANIEAARTGIDAQLQGSLEEINRSAMNLASLNVKIGAASATGGRPNDLLDARQNEIDKLAAFTGGRPVPDADGNVSFMMPGGMALVSGVRAGQFSALPDPANRGHLALRLTPSDGSSPVPVANDRVGGKLGGMLDARDTALGTAMSQLDQFAYDLMGQLNPLQSAGYGLGGTTGVPMFSPVALVAGAAGAMAVASGFNANTIGASTTAAGVPGDSGQLFAMMDTERAALTGGRDASSTLAKIVSDFGGAASRAQAVAEHDKAIRGHLTEMRDSLNGVSIDEELINLTKSQRAYEAVMKVITTADKMLETLMAIR